LNLIGIILDRIGVPLARVLPGNSNRFRTEAIKMIDVQDGVLAMFLLEPDMIARENQVSVKIPRVRSPIEDDSD
jgi:hypothetical protein